MLKKFSVKNYKNFKNELTIDFSRLAKYQFNQECTLNGLLSKIIVYGKNATGKTNLGRALVDIHDVLFGVRDFDDIFGTDPAFLNVSSEENKAVFSYTFVFDQNEIVYSYQKYNKADLAAESLILNGRRIFELTSETGKINFKVMELNLLGLSTVNYEQYTDSSGIDDNGSHGVRLSFLRWLLNNTAIPADSAVKKLEDYVSDMRMVTTFSEMNIKYYVSNSKLFRNENEVAELERFLQTMGVEAYLTSRELPEGKVALYFTNKDHNAEKLIGFNDNASSGTLALLNLYLRLRPYKTTSLLYLDEFDAYYHYEMAENVVEYFKKFFPDTQVIITSHNTNLMTNRIMRPDCLFILSRNGKLTALDRATDRELREGHNLEKMYQSGEFAEYE